MSSFNLGDAIYQLISFIILILIIVFLVRLFRTFSKRRNQLDRIEKKVDALDEKIKQDHH